MIPLRAFYRESCSAPVGVSFHVLVINLAERHTPATRRGEEAGRERSEGANDESARGSDLMPSKLPLKDGGEGR